MCYVPTRVFKRIMSSLMEFICCAIQSLRRVFHQLLYVILMMKKGNTGKPSLLVPSQTVLATRDQAIQFVW